MSRVPSLGAIDKLTKRYTYIKIAVKGNEYSCPECDKDLIAVKGAKLAHHFRHKVKNAAPCYYYNRPTESQIHKDAKILLKNLLENKVPISFTRCCTSCTKIRKFNIPEINANSVIKLEHGFEHNGRKIADVAYINNNKLAYIFEIYNTHKTRSENRPEPWFEIDAKELINLVNDNDSENLVIPCIRIEKCTRCLELAELKRYSLTKYVRAKLGQNLQNPEYDGNGKVKHRRLDLSCTGCHRDNNNCNSNCLGGKEGHSCNDVRYKNNREICDLFNNDDDMQQYRIVVYTWKGRPEIYVVRKEDYENMDYWNNKYWHDGINGDLKLPYRRQLDSGKYGGTVGAFVHLLNYAREYL